MGPISPLPLDSQVLGWEGGLPWSPDGSQVAVLTEGAGLVVAAYDEGFTGTAHPYNGHFLDLGSVMDCWVEWVPGGLSMYGGSPGFCDHVVEVPLDSSTPAQTLPMQITGLASWRPQPETSPTPSSQPTDAQPTVVLP
jgi:hypothetical protein